MVSLLALAAGPGRAQAPPQFATSAEAVYVEAFVTRRGEPLTGLTGADFVLFDHGVRQSAELVDAAQVPLEVVLVFDTSDSVSGPSLQLLQGAALAFLAGLKPMDRVRLLTFSHELTDHLGGTRDPDAARRAIARLTAGGSTALFDAAYAGLALCEGLAGRPLLLLFSDGADTMSWLDQAAVLEVARESNALVYVVAAGSTSGPALHREPGREGELAERDPRRRFLRRLSEDSGGRLLLSPSPEELRGAFLGILAELRTRYLLSFVPRCASREGWHELEVKLHAKAHVRSRRGYFRGPAG
jgi:VWFA-related protein